MEDTITVYYDEGLDRVSVQVDIASLTDVWDPRKTRTMTSKLGNTTDYDRYLEHITTTRFRTPLDGLDVFLQELRQIVEIKRRQYIDRMLVQLEERMNEIRGWY